MRSGSEGCAPRATRWASASSTVLRMMWGSPPWKPHATLAELMNGMMASSAPSVQRPYDSPMSQLRSITLVLIPLPLFQMRSPRLRLQLALPFKCARLACGCSSPYHSNALASPAAAARPAIQMRSPRLRLQLALPEHAAERLDEAVDVGVGHGQRAGAEPALGEQHALVDQPQERPRGCGRVLWPRRAVVAELLLRVVDPEERAGAADLARGALLAQQAAHPVPQPLAERLETRVGLRGELLHGRDAPGHGERVRVEGAAVVDAALAVARVVGIHHVRAPAEGADREPAADDLAERGEVRADAEALLRT